MVSSANSTKAKNTISLSSAKLIIDMKNISTLSANFTITINYFNSLQTLPIGKKLISMTSAKSTIFENNNVSIILRIRVDIGWHVQHI